MIVLRLEMWPGGNEAKKYELGRLYARNLAGRCNATGGKRADYRAEVSRKGNFGPVETHAAPARSGVVVDWPRNSYNVWRLVLRLILACFPEDAARAPRLPEIPPDPPEQRADAA